MQTVKKYLEFVQHMHHSISVERFYLVKPNGKLRPIGNPNSWTKMVLKGIEIIMRELLRGKIGSYQHGFMEAKGCQTCSMEVIRKLRSNPTNNVFEFDLSAFFNKVNVIRVCDAIKEDYGAIGDWIRAITLLNIPRIDKKEIAEEEELKVRKVAANGNKGQAIIHRFGFTQGSPLSPLLCAYALELGEIGKIENLTMFADDGIVISPEKELDLKAKLSTYLLKASGAKVAEDKPLGLTRQFKFLGLDYDMDKRTVSYTVRYIDPKKVRVEEKKRILEEIIAKHGHDRAYKTIIKALAGKRLIRLSKTGSKEAPAELYALYTTLKTFSESLDNPDDRAFIPIIHYAAQDGSTLTPTNREARKNDPRSLINQIGDVAE